jgi:hypothetical protein
MNKTVCKTIFTIDLLRGQGLPTKSNPASIMVAVLIFIVPLAAAITLSGMFFWNKVQMSLIKKEIASVDAQTAKLSDAIEFQKSMEAQKLLHNKYLSDVKTTIEKFNQWSPIIVTLADNMPSSITLTELEVKLDSVKKKVAKKDNPKEMTEINVPVTTLRIRMCDSSTENNEQAVKNFRDYIRTSSVLGPKLEKVGFDRESGVIDGQDVVYYMMDCVFKSGA